MRRKNYNALLILAALWVMLGVSSFPSILAAQTGEIHVLVKTSSGVGLASARVSVLEVPLIQLGSQPPQLSNSRVGLTDVQGSVKFIVPVGVYSVCAQLPNSTLVNSCVWLGRPQSYRLVSNSVVSVPLTLQQGTMLTLKINDPLELLQKETTIGKYVRVAVSSPGGHWIPMMADKNILKARTFSILAPTDVAIKIQLESSFYLFSSVTGLSLSTAEEPDKALIPITTRSGIGSLTSLPDVNISGLR